jgi:phosphotransferase system HPr (HPr) family protein
MYDRSIIVTSKGGLHARPATNFVKCAKSFTSKITVTNDGRSADAKSILGILTLAVSQGSEISIAAEGEDEANAVDSLAELVNDSK